MSDYNSNVVDKIKQDGWARVCLLSKEAMRAEIARVVRQGWLDRVAPLIGLSKQDGIDRVVRLARQDRVARIIRLSEQARRSAKIG